MIYENAQKLFKNGNARKLIKTLRNCRFKARNEAWRGGHKKTPKKNIKPLTNSQFKGSN